MPIISALIRRCRVWLFLLVAAMPAAALAQAAAVQVSVPGRPPLALDRAALATLPRAQAQAASHDEPPSLWQGVALADVLAKAGAPAGKALRGRALASYVRVTAADGYQVVFGLGELDPGVGHAQALLADRHEGKPLDKDGPFRLVVPGDRRAARWVRNVVRIEVVDGAAP